MPVAASPADDSSNSTDAGFVDDEAAALYSTGLAKFDAGDYEAALVDLDASLAIESSAKALYAKAQTLNKLERCREAVPLYNNVLSTLPKEHPARAAVKDALVTCAEKLAEEDDAPPPIPEPIEVERVDDPEPVDDSGKGTPPKAWYKDPYAPILIGLGAAGVGVGGFFLVQAAEEKAKQPMQYDDFESKGERVQALQIRGGVILGVGGALVLAGAIRWAVLGARGRRANTAFVPAVSPRWSGFAIRGSF